MTDPAPNRLLPPDWIREGAGLLWWTLILFAARNLILRLLGENLFVNAALIASGEIFIALILVFALKLSPGKLVALALLDQLVRWIVA